MNLNLGCGPFWRAAPEGWEHADVADYGQRFVIDLAQPDTWPVELDGGINLAVMHHVLHMLDPDQARAFLAALHDRMTPGATFRVGERDLWAGLGAFQNGGQWLLDVVADAVEPTLDGKLLRWLTWHGTVRTLWSPISLAELFVRTGWADAYTADHGHSCAPEGALLDNRPWETFYVEAIA